MSWTKAMKDPASIFENDCLTYQDNCLNPLRLLFYRDISCVHFYHSPFFPEVLCSRLAWKHQSSNFSVSESSVKPVKIPISKPYTQKFSFIGWMLEVIGWRHFKLHWNRSPKSILVSCFKAFLWEGWNCLS